jgi:uncharacterized protein YbbC (DUF1343 family)
VDDATDARTALPTVSLYNEHREVSAHAFDDLDVVLIDLQDVGARFYTYLATANQVARATARVDLRVVVLDRPNPIAWMGAFGNRVVDDHESLVGIAGLPVTHAATIGELLTFLADREQRPLPTVVPLETWHRRMTWEQTGLPWVSPSPNLPTIDSAMLYPITCWIEGTSLSEGRGTTRPFEIIGAPELDGYALAERLGHLEVAGLDYRPTFFEPTFSKHAGKRCHGIQIHHVGHLGGHVFNLGPHLLAACFTLTRETFAWRGDGNRRFIDLLGGSDELRETVSSGESVDDMLASWKTSTMTYVDEIAQSLMYGPIPQI